MESAHAPAVLDVLPLPSSTARPRMNSDLKDGL
jgi:hypothetical protein